MDALYAGRQLGPYEILARVGAGGMGEVYRARDTRLGREVALKFIREDAISDAEGRGRFLREARATSVLNHPNIVTLHDICEIEGFRFLVAEYVAGRTLAACLAARPLALPECLRIALQICAALECAYVAGIVHRDLKPANIVITDSGSVKILDFGIAKIVELAPHSENTDTETLLTQPGALVGTGPYMSPEQVQGRPVDARSDIFSFGTILYEMLTGRRAFARGTPVATFAAIMSEQPPAAPVPPATQAILRRCLAKDPAERFSSPAELRTALEAAVSTGACPSVAVLPLADLSPRGDHEWLADGLAEDMISALSRVSGIRVAARTSSFRFKHRNEDLFEIGRVLHVGAVLEGSIRVIAEKIRITVQLVDLADGFPLWSERFDRRVDDIFAVQDEIATAVVQAFRDKFGIDSCPVQVPSPTHKGEAYRLYLQGRFWWNRRDAVSVRKAISFFSQATESDPSFALAFSGLADAHSSLAYFGAEDPKPHARQCREFASLAADLVRDRPEVQISLGLASWMELDIRACERHYRRASELAPHHSAALYSYGSVLGALRRYEAAITYCNRALDVEPLLLPALTWRGMVLHLARRYEEAVRQYKQALEVEPNLFRALVEMAFPLIMLQRWTEALDVLERAESVYGDHPRIVSFRGHIAGRAGDSSGARSVLDRLAALEQVRFVSGFDRALVWIGLGDLGAAIAELERCIEQQYSGILSCASLPIFDPLRREPRFDALMNTLHVATVDVRAS